ncbi:MAG: A/G-specific adenine glycosylase [Methylobacteriaceae bacterium]|nr:A/G-specific adenine glycosylase [Methylobacteriaceae bacterium]
MSWTAGWRRPKFMSADVAAALLAWYDRHARALPWRAPPGVVADPYAVWLSEIMLQQTTVAAVKPFYEKFLAAWPTVEALAAAPTDDVMKAWAGLGYYSRARNLHAAAQAVAREHGGRFPDTEEGLRALPGVGPYTAAAIAAIAFGRCAVVVDGNVERVVARLFRIETPLPAAKPALRAAAATITPHARPGDFAQAMMDLGATVCTPRRPACALCPLTRDCAARRAGVEDALPARAAKAARRKRAGVVFYARRADGAVLLRTRPPKGLLGGMAELPGSAWSADFDLAKALDAAPARANWRRLEGAVTHVFTHFELTLTVFAAAFPMRAPAPAGMRWVGAEALDGEALPSLMRKAVALARAAQG